MTTKRYDFNVGPHSAGWPVSFNVPVTLDGTSQTSREPGSAGIVLDGSGHIAVWADSDADILMSAWRGNGTGHAGLYTPLPDPEPEPLGFAMVDRTPTPPPVPGA